MVKLFVGGFPLDMDEMELAKLFMPFGQVSTIKIVRDKKTKICKGYAFLEMRDQEAAVEAVKGLNGQVMDERKLAVNITEDKSLDQPNRSGPSFGDVPASKYVKVERTADPVKKKRPRRAL